MTAVPRIITNKTILTGLAPHFKGFSMFPNATVGKVTKQVAPKIATPKAVKGISLTLPSSLPSGLNKAFFVDCKHVR